MDFKKKKIRAYHFKQKEKNRIRQRLNVNKADTIGGGNASKNR